MKCIQYVTSFVPLAHNFRERESHTSHLKNIEADLEAQVAKVETAAREKAWRDHQGRIS